MQQADTTKEQLEQLKQEFEEFAYIVSHDLKAPVRAIANLSHWIEEDLGDNISEDVRQNMDLMRNRANRIERMIEALLKYSRVNRQDLDIALTNVNELLKAVQEALGSEKSLVLHVSQSLPTFDTYKTKLYQVFTNLLQNTVSFSPKPVVNVTVEFSKKGTDYEFVVSDDGIGIPEEALDKVFKLFYTVSPKDSVDTVGAGLAITKKIVQFVNGKVEAEQNSPHGTTIRFTWPS
ncbi:ATP-binding protein [Pontibacter silvestris]|uniref:histidine kinase n=1 Tax=Pontibacter silvestris TaxID=2305183 RepID=A0ABW4WSS3_9BACT|nr:HAMP domain-containing sensor histidine kinase [Pontibacter silvestris]MCC9137765.1 HAMP domain-containing histidine kinase [Pontibacter silvestris]